MLLETERRQEMEAAISTPRDPHDDGWGFFGAGALQAQFVRRPSRSPGVCYEIRGEIRNLRLFRSCSTRPGSSLVVGYARIAAEPSALYYLLRMLESLHVPVRRELESVGILDGETFELAVGSGVQAAARFTWRGGAAPAGWEDLAQLVESCIKGFDGLEVVDADSQHA